MENKQDNDCFRCGEPDESFLENLYGHIVCSACKIKLGLFHDQTIKKHINAFERNKNINPERQSYKEDVDYRIMMMEKDYISKRIKLLHIRDRISTLT